MHKIRTLIDGTEVPDYDEAIDLTIHTKCPGKWLLIDMETGQQYVGLKEPTEYGKWLRVDETY